MDWGLNYPNGNPPPSSSFDRDGSILGGHIGIQHQFGQWVLGAEVSLSDGFGAKNITGINLWSPQVGDLRTHMGPLVTATGRVGYSMNRWLGYVKAGFAGANIRLDADDNVPPDFGFSTRNFHTGWTAGVGVELLEGPQSLVVIEWCRLGDNGPLERGQRLADRVDVHLAEYFVELQFVFGDRLQALDAGVVGVAHLDGVGDRPDGVGQPMPDDHLAV